MSSISAGTFLVFIVLCPGFLFLTGFSMFGRLRVADNQHGPIFDVAAFVTSSTLFHATFGSLYFFTAERYRPGLIAFIFQIGSPASYPVTSAIKILVLYFLLVSVISLLAGCFLINLIENGTIPTDRLHGPYYRIVKGRREAPPTYVSVLSTVSASASFLIYEGILVELSFLAYKRINYIVIRNPSRVLLKIENDKAFMCSDYTKIDDEYDISTSDNADSAPILVIPGDKITNVLFSPMQIEVQPAPARETPAS